MSNLNVETIATLINDINNISQKDFYYTTYKRGYILYLGNQRIGEKMTIKELWKVLTAIFSIYNNSPD